MGVARSLSPILSLTVGLSELCILVILRSVVESIDALTCSSLTTSSWWVQSSGSKYMQNGSEPHMPSQHPRLGTLHTGSFLFVAIKVTAYSFSKHAIFALENILLSGSWQSAPGKVLFLFSIFP